MYICKYCGKSFETKQQLGGHINKCTSNPNYSREKILQSLIKARSAKQSKLKNKDTNEYQCKYCDKICIGKNSLTQHELRCKKNPDRIIVHSNFIKYNNDVKEGKIIKTYKNHYDKAVKLNQEKPRLSIEARNKISKAQKNKIVSKETREKISNTQKNNYRGKSRWYTQIQHRTSYAEQYFFNIFPNSSKHYHVDRYFLDIAYPSHKIYIEIDGEQHKKDLKVIEHDKERTLNLDKLGWTLIDRIYWPDFSKLNNDERIIFINSILNILKEKNIEP